MQTGDERNVIARLDVGWIRHRQRQRRTTSRDRNDLVPERCLHRNEADDLRIEIELSQLDGRHAVLPAQSERDIFIAEHAEADERRAEAAAARALMVQRDVELCLGDAPLAEQQLTETNSHDPFGDTAATSGPVSPSLVPP